MKCQPRASIAKVTHRCPLHCVYRSRDFGGRRRQAMLLTGDAAAMDPACSLAPTHTLIEETLVRVNTSAADPAAPGWIDRIDAR